jgi:hypothetical protein
MSPWRENGAHLPPDQSEGRVAAVEIKGRATRNSLLHKPRNCPDRPPYQGADQGLWETPGLRNGFVQQAGKPQCHSVCCFDVVPGCCIDARKWSSSCSSADQPPRRLARPAAMSWSPSPGPPTTAGLSGWPTRSPPRWPQTTSPRASTWCAPRPIPSAWPPPSCWPSPPNAAAGNAAGARCCWAPPPRPRQQAPTRPTRPGAGISWRRGLPELSRPR